MDLDPGQLRALDVAVSQGTFEAAARALHVTPSAISQRIRALEIATGRVLLVRTRPVQVTDSGRVVLRLARQVALLAAEAARELGSGPGDGEAPRQRPSVPVAVSADSLATWILPALAPLAADLDLHLHREDQDRTTVLLREGSVMAAVTAEAEPVPGCRSVRLGAMRYRPMAAPGFAARWFSGGATPQALAEAPVVVFDRHDDLQHGFLRRRADRPSPDAPVEPPVHLVPSSEGFLTAVRLGMGWGMLPDLQSAPHERDGELVDVDPRGGVDVVLHWQQWKLRSQSLDRVAAAVGEAARQRLIQSGARAAPSE
ncbi:LysR family transcriptional regulator (chromosome initiation inhibitor) [Kineococcus xinjiangensis]|uniref:LysR family transcriptional regulator (Chromosome initiation inhibitor) n=1 Tax=Kineococcus xinjiangensis TaxID=512762 RepID=A0A2S6IGQ4_9ACTN|nr:LysR family transcriptional regulator ArgP [Kineococcus xinjiangensis]PPK93393.1 LysR family transcriptional regulator (chromosome initiation inhibitor) [Kineococcus xinjiangensis]